MKRQYYLIRVLIILSAFCQSGYSQNGERLDDIKGYRLKTNKYVFAYYGKADNTVDINNYRTLNSSVFFNQISPPLEQTQNGKIYVQIIIPGQKQENLAPIKNGQPVSSTDFDQLLWIEKIVLTDAEPVYYKFRNDFVAGALTLPFKFRPAVGDRSASYIDGSFNVGPYVGYKVRLGSSRPFYVSGIISGGFTTITYNSANNSGIIDKEKTETGAGFQYGGGVVFDFYKIELGFILGADFGMGDLSKTFVYQNNLWMGFSLNFNFLNNKPSDKETKNVSNK